MPKKPPPTRYIAFLRGMNLGYRRIKMDDLRVLFEELKFANVETFIASGNVIFDTPSVDSAGLEKRIEAHLEKSLGFAVDTFLRTPAELAAVAEHVPYTTDELVDGHALHVGFLKRVLTETEQVKLADFCTTADDFRSHGREWYWLCQGKFTSSNVKWPLFARTIPVAHTARNMTTVRKLVAKYPAQ